MTKRVWAVNILLIVFFAGGCTKFDLLNATVPACGYDRIADIAYGDNPRQRLDVYRSTQVKSNGRVVIFFYGGYWREGDRANYRFVGQALAAKGFIAVVPDYRLYPETTFPGFVQDGALAVRWVVDHIAQFDGDPKQLYLLGHSAGAHTAALLTLNAEYLRAVGLDQSIVRGAAGLSGPYDFVPKGEDRAVFSMQPGDISNPAMHPANFVDNHAAPMLLLHGREDDFVLPENSTNLATAITKAGGKARSILYPGLGHATVVLAIARSFQWLAPVLDDCATFFMEN